VCANKEFPLLFPLSAQAEALAAIEKTEQIIKNPQNDKGYTTAKEMIQDVLP
jgi:hypothetical protein